MSTTYSTTMAATPNYEEWYQTVQNTFNQEWHMVKIQRRDTEIKVEGGRCRGQRSRILQSINMSATFYISDAQSASALVTVFARCISEDVMFFVWNERNTRRELLHTTLRWCALQPHRPSIVLTYATIHFDVDVWWFYSRMPTNYATIFDFKMLTAFSDAAVHARIKACLHAGYRIPTATSDTLIAHGNYYGVREGCAPSLIPLLGRYTVHVPEQQRHKLVNSAHYRETSADRLYLLVKRVELFHFDAQATRVI